MSKYVIDDSTLTGIADAIRTKEETSDPIPVEEMAERIGAIETGVTLPTLSNPASPSEILNGYEAIGEDGSVIEGEALATASTATAADIMSGKTAYNSAGELLTGTAVKGAEIITLTGTIETLTSASGSKTFSFKTGYKKIFAYVYNSSVDATNTPAYSGYRSTFVYDADNSLNNISMTSSTGMNVSYSRTTQTMKLTCSMSSALSIYKTTFHIFVWVIY